MTSFKKHIRNNIANKQTLIKLSSEEKERVKENFEIQLIKYINLSKLNFNLFTSSLIISDIS